MATGDERTFRGADVGSGRPSVVYVAFGLVTPTKAHNLQTVNTVDALVARGVRVTFVNPLLADIGYERNLPRTYTVLIPPTRLFERYSRLWSTGRYWMLFFDRSLFALRALAVVRRSESTVVVTRDLVTCFYLLALRWLIRKPIVYEMHTLEQVMFSAGLEPSGERADDGIAARMRTITKGAFAGYQADQSIPGRLYAGFITWVENWALRHADSVLTLTHVVAQDLRMRLGARDVRVVPSGHRIRSSELPDRARCRQLLDLPAERRIAIYAGLSFHDKGLPLLFATAQCLPDDCMIVIVGAEAKQRAALENFRDELGLQGKVVILPRVPHQHVPEYLRAADVGLLLYPDTRYLAEFSSPLKLVEYLACGLPVIATDLPALRELVIEGENGTLIPADDVPTMARTIAETLRDAAKLRRLAVGAAAAAQRYDYAHRGRRIEEAIVAVARMMEPAWCQCT